MKGDAMYGSEVTLALGPNAGLAATIGGIVFGVIIVLFIGIKFLGGRNKD